ncbi:hypothetical protein CCP2SC5_30009 [Azospirillaceae bacterium]
MTFSIVCLAFGSRGACVGAESALCSFFVNRELELKKDFEIKKNAFLIFF